MTPTNQPAKPFRVTKCGDELSRHATYAVHGFWSGDNVRVSQSRDLRDLKWEAPEINWSCGGRDFTKEPDGITAAECFAKAMIAAVKMARRWQKETNHEG